MAVITLTIPDDRIAEVLDAFDEAFVGRTEVGATKAAWAKQQVAHFVRNITTDAQRRAVIRAATITPVDIT